jgi:5-methylcytosine-specific restriction endonuclease McrA
VIPVTPAPEPASFDAKVRRPGRDAISELVGKASRTPRRGRRRKVVATRRDQIPSKEFPPLWRAALPEMRAAYSNLCAYLARYIEHATGSPSVDHVVAKSKDWKLVYEWSNYRLAASLINAKKSDLDLVLDPFALEPGLFALEFTACQVIPGPPARGDRVSKVEHTIDTLGLNRRECCAARQAYVDDYRAGPPDGIELPRLERRAPFVARELRRQKLLVRDDR